MARIILTKQGSFDADLMNAINAMFAELYGASVGGALPSGDIIVGNGGGVAAAVAMSGDGTMANTGALSIAPGIASAALVAGVAAGYKVARGVHQQAAASDTIVSGLTTVVAVVVQFRDAPTVKQFMCSGTIGNQSGAPAAGSFLLRTYKPTAVDNCTPIAATDFTDNLNFDWIAIGT